MNDYLLNYIFSFQHPNSNQDYSSLYNDKHYKSIENKRYKKYLARNLQIILNKSKTYYSEIVNESGSIDVDEIKEYLYLNHYNTTDLDILYYFKEVGILNMAEYYIELPYALGLSVLFCNIELLIVSISNYEYQHQSRVKYYKDYFYNYKEKQKNRIVLSILDNFQLKQLHNSTKL